jgi:hypothetical protein
VILRDHPLINFHGNRSWPPAWLWRSGNHTTHPRGEVGILKDVLLSSTPPANACYLIMEYNGCEYIGALLLSDSAFCLQTYRLLTDHHGQTIKEIGDIDLSHTL